ncbi:hypothetical protein CHLRE_03g189100v5 [Chlamydomonas reinhardtii]|uniref:PH domain-containing protein n=1 Tax=Chlamydomonas reinhardtii TaxID=3055 RepID=A8IRS9_CHLRE|nr:uncharacterized protein CHLRE_03g189100v5 [Chlamydomonas reinhardtii]PNW85493.1 hypothetical protein CHLRE_03g189100v5 [Chlamydomonas reinhardtii]|eukprot:XP_001692027.1 predicted protein [Chlamydomonas reinhardtii]
MTANPALVRTFANELCPAPFPEEVFVLRRAGVQIELQGVQTRVKGWQARGALYLSNVRLVFVADKPDELGLHAFDFPLVYIRQDKLNQPIFGCNNLAGQVWPAVERGGPSGELPPHEFRVYFKEGGIGTFYPLYYTLAERAKQAFAAAQERSRLAAAGLVDPNPPTYVAGLVSHAFVDPADPSTIYLAERQPVAEADRLPTAPRYTARYAHNYGEDEVYEPMDGQASAPGAPGAPAARNT